MVLLLALVLLSLAPAGADTPLPGDFNQDQQLDQADLQLLRAALGSADSRYDLNGDSRVDLCDFFRWVDQLEAHPPQPATPPYYAISSTQQITVASLTWYTLEVHNSNPFGISSLRLAGQAVDFAHPSLPLGDWEWFWFSDPAQPQGQARIKLMEQTWQPPEVERREEEVVLRYRRQNVLRRGVEVEVAYHLDARRPEFTVEYTVRNHSGQFLISPYMMVGFPGFANQQWVEEVSTAEKVRRPTRPFANFLAEAKARKVADYLLLRQDWDPQTQTPEALRGAVVLRAGEKGYTLTTTLTAAVGLKGAYIAHTNKPLYLTSHLYAFFQSLGEGQSRSVAVHYALSRGK